MNYTFDHDLLSSFKEYWDNRFFTTTSSYRAFTDQPAFQYTDKRFPDRKVFGSRHAQWIYDSNVATVPDVKIGGSQVISGYELDHINGRVLFTFTPGAEVTLDYVQKNLNSYITSDSESNILLRSMPDDETSSRNSFVKPYSLVNPAVYWKIFNTEIEPMCLGGAKYNTFFRVRGMVIAKSDYMIVGVNSFSRDLVGKCFTLLGSAQTPLNEWGDLKSPTWTYDGAVTAAVAANNDTLRIQNVRCWPIDPDSFLDDNHSAHISIIDFFIEAHRNLV